MLLLALAIKQKKLMGQASQEGGGAAGTWCKDICYETKPFCFEDKNAELLQKVILYDTFIIRAKSYTYKFKSVTKSGM